MESLSLKQFYEAAIENAKMNDLIVDANYLEDYALNAYNVSYSLTSEQINELISISKIEYSNADEYYHLTKHLADVQL